MASTPKHSSSIKSSIACLRVSAGFSAMHGSEPCLHGPLRWRGQFKDIGVFPVGAQMAAQVPPNGRICAHTGLKLAKLYSLLNGRRQVMNCSNSKPGIVPYREQKRVGRCAAHGRVLQYRAGGCWVADAIRVQQKACKQTHAIITGRTNQAVHFRLLFN